ncbi:DUF3618 domain-containing protein [Streptomyces sp. NPDC058646]|uniref:DUF3618 domain-containing protein n=1 Tax=Streptomyces sp. NPDC058646 TaxID=3346574 RepID=UPI0036681A4F
MNRTPEEHGSQPEADRLRAQVEDGRAELGRAVEALAARADVRSQVRAKAVTATHQARGRAVAAGHHAREQAAAATHQVGRTASRAVRRERWLVALETGCLVWLAARQVAGRRHS